jgi:hypothetical protein
MSIYKTRLVRQMYKDIYLPIICYASKSQFYSIVGECKCMTDCKFIRELRRTRDYPSSSPVKDPESQK